MTDTSSATQTELAMLTALLDIEDPLERAKMASSLLVIHQQLVRYASRVRREAVFELVQHRYRPIILAKELNISRARIHQLLNEAARENYE